jgi:hypothetical protein
MCKSESAGHGVFGTGLNLGICEGVFGHRGSSCCVEEKDADRESELLELKLMLRNAVERDVLRIVEKANFFGRGLQGEGEASTEGTRDKTEAQDAALSRTRGCCKTRAEDSTMGGSIPLRLFGRMLDEESSSSSYSSSCATAVGRAARALREPVRGRAVLVRWVAAAETGRADDSASGGGGGFREFRLLVVLERFITLEVVCVLRPGGSPARSAKVFLLGAGSGTATDERSMGVLPGATAETYRLSLCA